MIVWTRVDEVLWHRTHDTVVLLPPGREEPFRIRGAGAEVWQRLAVPAVLDDMIVALAQTYRERPEQVARDLLPFLEDLERLRAVRRIP
ncbi:MAG: PqqD family protein [Actinobacteria bacterium]|nr:PqqD family protein [Actinomycetota bacterium]